MGQQERSSCSPDRTSAPVNIHCADLGQQEVIHWADTPVAETIKQTQCDKEVRSPMNMIIRSKVKPECVVEVEAGVKKMFAAIERARGGLEAVGHERVRRAALPGDRRVRPVRDAEDRLLWNGGR